MSDPKAERYRKRLGEYQTALAAMGITSGVDDVRIEHHFECLADWSLVLTLEEMIDWFEERRHCPPMTVSPIPLNQVRGWNADPETGDIHHESGEFFIVRGVRVSESTTREVGESGWDQPILEQVGLDGGLLGLVRQRIEGVPHYLVEAKAEPGNYRVVQLSPTLQATFSNLKRAHKGRKPLFAEIFEAPHENGATVLYDRWLSEDGGRLYLKRNKGMLVEVPEGTIGEVPAGFIWMSMFQIKACLQLDAWVNPHIRGIIAHL